MTCVGIRYADRLVRAQSGDEGATSSWSGFGQFPAGVGRFVESSHHSPPSPLSPQPRTSREGENLDGVGTHKVHNEAVARMTPLYVDTIYKYTGPVCT
ncbi:hypothetical protein NUW58_g3046 [Xylaria curta]|uniref:Uncharacterized protein n=1 Tax=Xylaria curta TaxID=42375 RepID=A0ACC1PF36_9PEZI|nr:hypothetical protein NUW58_g3046 [Xylaria curta]